MTRIETLVDAVFAFAFAMRVISIEQISQSTEELLKPSKDIPDFSFFSALNVIITDNNYAPIPGFINAALGITIPLVHRICYRSTSEDTSY